MSIFSPGVRLRRGEWLVGTKFIPPWIWKKHYLTDLEGRRPTTDDVPQRILSFRRKDVPVPSFQTLRETDGKYLVVDAGLTKLGPAILLVGLSFLLVPASFVLSLLYYPLFPWIVAAAFLLVPLAHLGLWLQYIAWWTRYEVVTVIAIYIRSGWWNIIRDTLNEPQINKVRQEPRGNNRVAQSIWTWLGIGEILIFEDPNSGPVHTMTDVPNPEGVEALCRGLVNIGTAAAVDAERNSALTAALLEEMALEGGVTQDRIDEVKRGLAFPDTH